MNDINVLAVTENLLYFNLNNRRYLKNNNYYEDINLMSRLSLLVKLRAQMTTGVVQKKQPIHGVYNHVIYLYY